MAEGQTEEAPPTSEEEHGPPIKEIFKAAMKKFFGLTYDPCTETVVEDGTSIEVMAYISVFMLIILVFMEKRTKKCPGCCGGRGGIMLSVNFLENKTTRGMVVAAFIFTASDLWRFISTFNAEVQGLPAFFSAFLKTLAVMVFSLSYIPLFHCISVNTFFRQFLGLLYIVTSTSLSLAESTSVCRMSELSNERLSYQLLKYFVLLPSGGYLAFKFMHRMFLIVGDYRQPSPPVYVHPYQVEYIKNVLKPRPKTKTKEEAATMKEKLNVVVHKLSYHCVPGFRYSISIFISIAVGLLIYLLLIRKTVGKSIDAYQLLKNKLEANKEPLSDLMPNVFVLVGKVVSMIGKGKLEPMEINGTTMITLFQFANDQVDCVFVSFFVAVALSTVQVGLTVLLMLKSYRKNLLRLYRQEINEDLMNAKRFDHVSLVVSAIQFTGYQVAHMVWGYGLQSLVFFILFFLLGELIFLPLSFGYWGVIEVIFNKVGPILLIMLITMVIQRILVQRVFLIDKGTVFGIDNRKAFYNFMFFMFYYNVLTGMITCIVRVLKAMLLGVWFFPRLDMSIFPRIGERFDTGYKAYVCLLALEQLQSNIILDTFFQLLIESSKMGPRRTARRKRQIITPDAYCFIQEERALRRNYVWNDDMQLVYQASSKQRKPMLLSPNRITVFPVAHITNDKRARNRWFLAWTLIHNPSVQQYRRWPKANQRLRF